MHALNTLCIFLLLAIPAMPRGQGSPDLDAILQRIQSLEKSNQALSEEVRALRGELAAIRKQPPAKEAAAAGEPAATATAALEERVEVNERRIEEQAQTKVEASQKYPVRLTGMVLMNLFLNSSHTGGFDNPLTASLASGPGSGGATLRQSFLGLEFRGPRTFGNGQVHGSVYMDFFSGSGQPYASEFRLRTARLDIDWKTRSVMVGQDKPLIAVREPDSLARVGVSPLSDAGNLWFWQPQVRFEQRLRLTGNTGIRAQAALFETNENAALGSYTATIERARPAIEGRFEFWHAFGERTRVEIAPGFHESTTHVNGTSIPSRLFSLDWFANPWEKLEISGTLFKGQDVATMGSTIFGVYAPKPGYFEGVRSHGGWTQFKFLATNKLTFNLFGGLHDGRNSDLLSGDIARNRSFAANCMYRLAPNVVLGLEALQVRTTYQEKGTRLNNHYDVAIAYLF